MTTRWRNGWIFSPAGDVAVFVGPLVLAAVIVAGFARTGALDVDLPPWAFALLIVGCDVAHVWSTLFRTYLDPDERTRRPALYAGVPIACFAAGVLLYLLDDTGLLFWRVLAYVAAYHFVRQQIGWMAYAARRAGERFAFDWKLDRIAIYNATLFPLLWWHAHLPRAFDWFVTGDFVAGVPAWAGDVGLVVHWTINALYVGRQVYLFASGRGVNLAKLLVWATTWCAWYGGIVWLDSDVAFTATNVLAHGIPYLAIVRRWGKSRWRGAGGFLGAAFRPAGVLLFYGVVLGIAFAEEGLWDRLVWHDHGGLFPGLEVSLGPSLLAIVVPLLTVPQATHYVLDAYLWRFGDRNPGLAENLGFQPRS